MVTDVHWLSHATVINPLIFQHWLGHCIVAIQWSLSTGEASATPQARKCQGLRCNETAQFNRHKVGAENQVPPGASTRTFLPVVSRCRDVARPGPRIRFDLGRDHKAPNDSLRDSS